jgi:hypothetical protein
MRRTWTLAGRTSTLAGRTWFLVERMRKEVRTTSPSMSGAAKTSVAASDEEYQRGRVATYIGTPPFSTSSSDTS